MIVSLFGGSLHTFPVRGAEVLPLSGQLARSQSSSSSPSPSVIDHSGIFRSRLVRPFFTDEIQSAVDAASGKISFTEGLIRLDRGAPISLPHPNYNEHLLGGLQGQLAHRYSTGYGEEVFQKAASGYMKSRFNVDVDPLTEVRAISGSSMGLQEVIQNLFPSRNMKPLIILPTPTYASYMKYVELAREDVFYLELNPENKYMPDMNEIWTNGLGEKANEYDHVLFVMNYPHNPTGVSATKDYLSEVVEFAKNKNITILYDLAYGDIYSEKSGKPHSILEIPGAMDLAIEVHSLSKSFRVTGDRIGFAVGNEELIKSIADLTVWNHAAGPPRYIQHAAAMSLSDEVMLKDIEAMNLKYFDRREKMISGLKELGWKFDESQINNPSFYLWIPVQGQYTKSWDFFHELLNEAGVVVVPGEVFNDDKHVRIALLYDDVDLILNRLRMGGFNYKSA